MHIIIAILTFLSLLFTVLFYGQRIGIDFRNLNPFAWHRRRSFRKKYDGDPLYKLTDPIDVAGALLTLMAKVDSDMTSSQQAELINIFENDLHLDAKTAKDLVASSSHLLGNATLVSQKVGDIVRPSINNFSSNQAKSVMELLERMANLDGAPSANQSSLLTQAARAFASKLGADEQRWK